MLKISHAVFRKTALSLTVGVFVVIFVVAILVWRVSYLVGNISNDDLYFTQSLDGIELGRIDGASDSLISEGWVHLEIVRGLLSHASDDSEKNAAVYVLLNTTGGKAVSFGDTSSWGAITFETNPNGDLEINGVGKIK